MNINMSSMEDRMRHDPQFHHLVKVMEGAIEQLQLTPSEVRAAAMLATIRVEQRNPVIRPLMREMEEKLRKDKQLIDLMKAGLS